MNIATMRIQFGKNFAFSLPDSTDSTDAAQIRTILSQFRSPQGLSLAMRYTRDDIDCEVHWPDE